jgi:Ca2+:H+ antiporter
VNAALIVFAVVVFLLLLFAISAIKVAREYERGIVFRLGRLLPQPKGPGLFILIPIVGNAAEHLVAVQVAYRNEMDLSVEIAVSSSLQIALFVAPVLVFISLLIGNPLHLIFNQFELIALIASVLIAALVSADGESNWLEGEELLAIYLILALAFFLIP